VGSWFVSSQVPRMFTSCLKANLCIKANFFVVVVRVLPVWTHWRC